MSTRVNGSNTSSIMGRFLCTLRVWESHALFNSGILARMRWYRVVLDEAHFVRNRYANYSDMPIIISYFTAKWDAFEQNSCMSTVKVSLDADWNPNHKRTVCKRAIYLLSCQIDP